MDKENHNGDGINGLENVWISRFRQIE